MLIVLSNIFLLGREQWVIEMGRLKPFEYFFTKKQQKSFFDNFHTIIYGA